MQMHKLGKQHVPDIYKQWGIASPVFLVYFYIKEGKHFETFSGSSTSNFTFIVSHFMAIAGYKVKIYFRPMWGSNPRPWD